MSSSESAATYAIGASFASTSHEWAASAYYVLAFTHYWFVAT